MLLMQSSIAIIFTSLKVSYYYFLVCLYTVQNSMICQICPLLNCFIIIIIIGVCWT